MLGDRMSNITTWHKAISEELEEQGETWDDIVSSTLSETEMHVEFDDRFGATEGKPFTVWTRKRVYFPVMYDGAEWVESVARDPDGKATTHMGGG